MAIWCERCGREHEERLLPCPWCWESRADGALVRLCVEQVGESEEVLEEIAAAFGVPVAPRSWYRLRDGDDPVTREAGQRAVEAWIRSGRALGFLRSIADPRAADALRAATTHPDRRIRAAAWASLGWSGTRADVPAAARALADVRDRVRHAAIGALAELGGDDAADALALHLERCEGEEREETIWALAWLNDRRALPLARVLAEREMSGQRRRTRYATAVRAVLRIGDPEDREALARRALDERLELGPRGGPAMHAYLPAVYAERPDEARRFELRLREESGLTPRYTMVESEPLQVRSVPRLALVDATNGDRPAARFGGQPDWLEAPQWPVTSEGRPLTFYGQLPLAGGRMAYVFVSAGDRAETWTPLGDGNALIVQPGGWSQLQTRATATGPQLWERAHDDERFRPIPERWVPIEHHVGIEPGHDPAEWSWPQLAPDEIRNDEHGAWNKIGGTPLWLQGDATPPGEGWEFAFQFSAGWAGEEMGDGAECYGFLNRDGRAAFCWDCH